MTATTMPKSPVVLSPVCTLRDKSDSGTRTVPITITADADWLAIRPHGYGEAEAMDGYGDPVLLEVWEGELRLLVATDINYADKSVVSLEGAREDRRREVTQEPFAHISELPDHREHPWRTAVVQVAGTGAAGALALQLITRSLWFRCTPLPSNEFEFAVKVEHAGWLLNWVLGRSPRA